MCIRDRYNAGAEFDDWRVEYLAEDWSQTYSGGTLVAYNMNYEYHAGKPAAITLAGGAYAVSYTHLDVDKRQVLSFC